jgi:hypothetical protein
MRELLTKNNMTVVPHPPYPPDLVLCDLSVSRHFDTIEVIRSELQAVLNTLIEHDFQDALKKLQTGWERCIRVEEDYLEGW